jgi:dipeptidyl aminopeptidase/acylaminoacyl peptidase
MGGILKRLFFLLCALAVMSLQAAPLDLTTLMRVPDYAQTQLSDDGRYLAVLVPIDGRVNLSVIDLDTRQPLTRVEVPGADIRYVKWVGSENLVFSLGQLGSSAVRSLNSGGLFMVSRDGKVRRKLAPTLAEWVASGPRRYVRTNVVDTIPGDGRNIIISANEVDENVHDLYRLEVTTGQRTLLTAQRPPRSHSWLLGSDQVPRVAVADHENTNDETTYWRDGAQAPWRALWRTTRTSGAMTVALHVEPDNRHLLIASNEGRDTMAVYRFDPQSGARELLAGHPRLDVGADAQGHSLDSLVFDASGHQVAGIRLDASTGETVWLDTDHARLQAMLDGALPGMRIQFARSFQGARTLVASYSDRKPMRWHVLDEKSGQLRALFTSRPWLDGGQLAAMQTHVYKTRDGLEFPVYLFQPTGRETGREPGRAAPAVVLIHGGPWVQHMPWGVFSGDFQDAQLLASRGYAVIVPAFRGTMGLGRKAYQASRGEFGRAMQDDIEDAVGWAVARGVADAGRICLMGASYGGYAALMGLVKTPDRYRCAVAGMPVTDLPAMIESGWSQVSRFDAPRLFWTEMVGDPRKDADALRAASPARQAAKIKAAVMLYGSVDDRRTPLEQMELMRSALRAQGQEPVWIAKYGEGHGFTGAANVVEVYEETFKFLRRHLQPQ